MAANVQETNYHLSLVPLIAINSKDAKACLASAVNRSSFIQVTAFIQLLIPIGILQGLQTCTNLSLTRLLSSGYT